MTFQIYFTSSTSSHFGTTSPTLWHGSTYMGYKPIFPDLFPSVTLFPLALWDRRHITGHHPHSWLGPSHVAAEHPQHKADRPRWNSTSKKCIFTTELFFLHSIKEELEMCLQKPKEQRSVGGTRQGYCYSCPRSQTSLLFGPRPSMTSKQVTQPHGPVSPPRGPCSRALLCSETAGGSIHGALDPGEKPATSTIGFGYWCHSLKMWLRAVDKENMFPSILFCAACHTNFCSFPTARPGWCYAEVNTEPLNIMQSTFHSRLQGSL